METIKNRFSLNTPWIIWSALIFFKIIGQATFSARNVFSKKNSKTALVFVSSRLGLCYNWILTVVMIGSTYILVRQELIPYDTMEGTGIIICLSTLGILAVNTILVSCCVRQSSFVRIGNHLIDIEWKLRRLRHPDKCGSVSLTIFVVYLLNGCLGFGVCISDILYVGVDSSDWWAHVPMFFVSWFILQYFSMVSLVNVAFVDVNRALQGVFKKSSTNSHPESLQESRRVFVSSSSIQFILEVRNLHERLCEVSVEISQFYSVPILPAITFSFCCLVYGIYNLLIYISMSVSRSNFFLISNTILLIVCQMYPVLLLSNKITGTVDEIGRTGKVVHHLLNCAINEDSRAELRQFSLQLLHHTVEFTANGYFLLDNAFLNSMVGAVSTYLMILIQLNPFNIEMGSVASLDPDYDWSYEDR